MISYSVKDISITIIRILSIKTNLSSQYKFAYFANRCSLQKTRENTLIINHPPDCSIIHYIFKEQACYLPVFLRLP